MKHRIRHFPFENDMNDEDDILRDETDDSDVPLDRMVQPGRMKFGRRRDHHDIADLERDPAHREDR